VTGESRRHEHASVTHLMHWLGQSTDIPPLPITRRVTELVGYLANDMLDELPVTPELTAGLRKLLEARDCFIRAAATWADDTRPAGADQG
jgi:hypothetical protein